ncbi:MAG: RagB/SusD family nutrient uptake outer membrane protein [Saprospiraceae bacterium]
MKILKISIIMLLALVGFSSCEGPLDEEIYSQLAPSTLFTTEDGISSVLNSAYSYAHRDDGAAASWSSYYLGGNPAGEIWGAGGSIEVLWVQLQDFTWDANHSQMLAAWTTFFNAIRDANIVLDNLGNPDFSAEFVSRATAEAHFIRGWSYSELYKLFGPLPVYTSSTDDPLQARASDADTRALIEAELTTSMAGLPDDAAFGRATKGVAMSVLAMYYMNTKQWQKAADLTKDVIGLGKYALQANYSDVFALNNEGNSEMIWALTKAPLGSAANAVQALTFPPNFPRPYPNNGVFAARTYLFDSFVNSFEATDTRKNMIITEWTTATGDPVEGLGKNQSFPNKYEFDPNSAGFAAGNDIPMIRYSDILLSRAEALNEISGPSDEAVNLVNDVKNRAQATPLSLAGLDKASLRDAILQERKWEFFHEGKTREFELRHDKFISNAVARGKNAKPHHVLFPIPQVELDANALLTQNDGY